MSPFLCKPHVFLSDFFPTEFSSFFRLIEGHLSCFCPTLALFCECLLLNPSYNQSLSGATTISLVRPSAITVSITTFPLSPHLAFFLKDITQSECNGRLSQCQLRFIAKDFRIEKRRGKVIPQMALTHLLACFCTRKKSNLWLVFFLSWIYQTFEFCNT